LNPSLEPQRLRQAFGKFATGVTIVTAADADGRAIGVTANSFSSLSLDPPLLLWSIGRNSSSYGVFQRTGHFAVHVLDQAQAALSQRFSARSVNRFEGVPVESGAGGCPLLPDYHVRFECSVSERHEGGDHLIMVGRILNVEQRPGSPLLFYGGRLARLHDAADAAAACSGAAAPEHAA
jgi:flavin reductase (DIM6/NTAB) family NADH-FMN oxidoreductase RutF